MRFHAFISGRVQGVFFRANVSAFCVSLGITGFVKNLPDGRVEVDAYGVKAKLDKLLIFIRNNPGASKVFDVVFKFSDEVSDCSVFESF